MLTYANPAARMFLSALVGLSLISDQVVAETRDATEIESLYLYHPKLDDHALRVISPDMLEVVRINTKQLSLPVESWNFTSAGVFNPPPAQSIHVSVDGVAVGIAEMGFKRRPLYAPLKVRDLRILNHLFLKLSTPLQPGQEVKVTNPDGTLWPASMKFETSADPFRFSPAIHVNQEGYTTSLPKKAMVGFYLGSMGELTIPAATYSLITADTGQEVFTGTFRHRPDQGYTYLPKPYQKVYEADFSDFTTEGEYCLKVEGLGISTPFLIQDNMVMGYVRAYANGLYHQRCGHALTFPFTRHVHDVCHHAPASIPLPVSEFTKAWNLIPAANWDFANNARHTAPRLEFAENQLYPFVKQGTIDVSGGHHDAGDYSKYTTNSARLIHYLVFAADSFGNAGQLDNLGIPESGDGKSDLLQEAKIEADYLAKMQDDDGGFFFLTYPRNRRYEEDVLPDKGDPQIVWPKNTASTAAATAALAQISSSPLFQQQFPEAAAMYRAKAIAGWNFLLNAIATHGKDGAYQKITHYGDLFMHDDELAWAACEMFLATGDPSCQQKLIEWYDPSSSATRRWGWWRLFECYGAAARSYAFGAVSGRLPASAFDATYMAKARAELIATADGLTERSNNGAYGSAFDSETKRFRTAGWYFSSAKAFDITVAHMLTPKPAYIDAIMTNMNFESGCNPVNVSYVTGYGLKRQREIVHQYAKNDHRILPPSGIPIGNIQAGFSYLHHYQSDLGALTFPNDGAQEAMYPFYDRWGDSYNVSTEFVVTDQARGLASLAYFASLVPAATQSWRTAEAVLEVPDHYVPVDTPVEITLHVPGLDLSQARVVWEAHGQEPVIGGPTWTFIPRNVGYLWVEAEAALPDGRRVSAAGNFSTRANPGDHEFPLDSKTLALYRFNGNFEDSGPHGLHLTAEGNVTLEDTNTGWMAEPSGKVARFEQMDDALKVTIPDSLIMPGNTPNEITIEAWIYPRGYVCHGKGNRSVISLYQYWDSSLELRDGMWNDPRTPQIASGSQIIVNSQNWQNNVRLNDWQLLRITHGANKKIVCSINNKIIGTLDTSGISYGRTNDWTLTIGNFRGDVDEVRISKGIRHAPFAVDEHTIALYRFDESLADYGPHGFHAVATGNVSYTPSAPSWMSSPSGNAIRFQGLDDFITATIPDNYIMSGTTPQPLTFEAWIYPRNYKAYSKGNYSLVSIYQWWDMNFELRDGIWNSPAEPLLGVSVEQLVRSATWKSLVPRNAWSHFKMTQSPAGEIKCYINGELIHTATITNLKYGRTTDWTMTVGNFDGDVDEVRISNIIR